jgi:hypothetical protein
MMHGMTKRLTRQRLTRLPGLVTATLVGVTVALAGCEYADPDTQYPTRSSGSSRSKTDPYAQSDSVFGEGGLTWGGDSSDTPTQGGGPGIGVNAFLWRASLDTLSFMPLASADPFGGVIITDWYTPPETLAERFKVNVFILGRDLRADGIRAAVFRQVRNPKGDWVDAEVSTETGTDLEDAILTRARQLRIATAN